MTIRKINPPICVGDLTATDFMMMDVHRPMTDEDINETNSQARLDKSARPLKVVEREAESVGSAHEEAPSKRCNFCFGPMPCDKHANVEYVKGDTTLDCTVVTTLAHANNMNLKEVVVIGVGHDGKEYMASSVADIAVSMYHCSRALYKLNQVVSGEAEFGDNPLDAA